jgi:hypothetical protein
MRRSHFALLVIVLLVAQPLLAKTYYVGSCKTGAYGTIGAAVAAVPAGSIIDVCPGTYPEQVVISQPLTLQGISSGGSAQPTIAMPSAGLTTITSIVFATVAAQVEVTAGPVNITGITVDGTAASSVCPTVWDIGIYYFSGASGTIDAVQTANQNCNTNGMGIYAENETATPLSITVENSNVTRASQFGIEACSTETPSTLTATIKNNYVANTSIGINIDCQTAATVTGNFVDTTSYMGIYAGSPSTKVTANTVTNAFDGIRVSGNGPVVSGNTVVDAEGGIVLDGVGTVTSNHIVNSAWGLWFSASGSTAEDNFIIQAQYGALLQCLTETVSGNTFVGAGVGFEEYPGTSTGTNKFYNVPTLTTGCAGSAPKR